ncbi:MAG: surface lipoprotein assembly modifier [Pseudomonadota bacterium]
MTRALRRAGFLCVLAVAALASASTTAVAQVSAITHGEGLAGLWASARTAVIDGDMTTAIPQLEALVAADPRNVHYRFELALALYRQGIRDRAAFHIEQLRGATLKPGERAAVEQLAREIENSSDWTGYVTFGIEPQSNTTGQTKDDTVNIGGFDFILNQDALGNSGTLYRLQLGATYTPLLGEAWRGNFGIDLETVRGPRTALYEDHTTLTFGLRPALTKGRFASFGLRAARHSYGTGTVNRSEALFASYGWRPTQAGQIKLGGTARRLRYDDPLRPDTKELGVTLTYGHAIGGNARLEGTLSRTNYYSDKPSDDGRRYAVSLSGLYAFDGGLIGGLTIRYSDDRRDGIVHLFGVQRHERKRSIEARLHHAQFTLFGFAPQLRVGYEVNDSSIPLTDHDNRYATIAFSRQF